MKRWTLHILLCLILGAISTVAVAWGGQYCSLSTERISGRLGDLDLGSKQSDDKRNESAMAPPREWIVESALWVLKEGADRAQGESSRSDIEFGWFRGLLTDWVGLHQTVDGRSVSGSIYQIAEITAVVHRTGWPMRALAFERREIEKSRRSTDPRRMVPELSWGVPWQRWAEPDQFTLANPLWPGFLIDSLFYAAIWFGVFFGFVSTKRLIRTKRGRCPRCGYDLRGQLAAGCSECGFGRGSFS